MVTTLSNKKPLSNLPAEASQLKGAMLLGILGKRTHMVKVNSQRKTIATESQV